jgi:hypothetical protein
VAIVEHLVGRLGECGAKLIASHRDVDRR